MAVIRTGQERECLTTVRHFDHGAARLLHTLLQSARELFHHQHSGTTVERLAEKAMAIGMHPTQRYEERLWPHLTGIRSQMLHDTTRGASQNARLAALEKAH
jgi:hypothetical protein